MKYRIVRDRYCGFEAQYRPRWWPFWMQCFGCNTSPSVRLARRVADMHACATVEHYEPGVDGEGRA